MADGRGVERALTVSTALTLLTAFTLLTAGCVHRIHRVDGLAVKPVPPLVVGVEQIDPLVGARLANTTADREPPPPIETDPVTCAVAAGPSTTAVYTPGWTQYHLVTMQEDAGYWDHSITQTAGKYPDSDAARAVFDALTAGLAGCTGPATATDALDGSTSSWRYAVQPGDAETLQWTATQADGQDWACFREARHVDQWVIQVAVCQVGNGRPAADEIIEELAERVGEA